MHGTYQFADGSSVTASPAAHSTIWDTNDLHDPHPFPARVCAITPATEVVPADTQVVKQYLRDHVPL